MKTKSNNDKILAFKLMIAFNKQHGYTIQVIHSDHETAIFSVQIFLNQQGIQLKTIAPFQHKHKNWNDIFKQLMPVSARFYQVSRSNYPTNYMLNYLWPCNKWSIIQFFQVSHHLSYSSEQKLTSTFKTLSPVALMLPFIMPNESPININLIQTMVFYYT